jgi:presenilin-like A22 family membrane protease
MVIIGVLVMICIIVPLVFYFKVTTPSTRHMISVPADCLAHHLTPSHSFVVPRQSFKEFQTKQADGITWNGKGEEMQDGKVVQVQSPLNDVEAD